MILLYKLSFADGTQYVGKTKNLEKRLYAHRKNPCNLGVHRRMARGMDFRCEVLSRHYKDAVAREREKKEIARLETPLNYYVGGKRVRAPEIRLDPRPMFARADKKRKRGARPTVRSPKPVPGSYTCSICRHKKNYTEFTRDRTRFNGLNSRCRTCINALWKRSQEIGWIDAVAERKKEFSGATIEERYAR